jgi:hypothetical protein
MSNETKCFFCNNDCRMDELAQLSYTSKYSCKYCGEYLLDPQDKNSLSSENEKRLRIACVLNERRLQGLGGVALSNKTDLEDTVLDYPQISIEDILSEYPRKASEVLNRTLLNLSRLPKNPFELIRLDMIGDYLHLFTESKDAAYTFLSELAEQEFIRFNTVKAGMQKNVFSLTTKFWAMIENFKENEVNNKRAFIAMWFDESMDVYYRDGLKPAVVEAGYDPIRIDRQEFSGKICDEIIAEIKRCKFIVSDFTGQRGGVYFEAGFAKGLGRPTIFTVKSDDVDNLHFDTRQYNHIVYESPEDLKKKLYNRICATIS